MSIWLVVAAVVSHVLAFAGGLVTYRRSRRWCPSCGLTLRCRTCTDAQVGAVSRA